MSSSKPDRLISEIVGASSKVRSHPGVNISELALAEEFGVSRTPVRESLKQLQTEGLVEIRPGSARLSPRRRAVRSSSCSR